MTYSFQKSLLTTWSIKTEPIKVDTPEFIYHKAFLPNTQLSSLQGHISTHSDLTGRLQQWFVKVPEDKNNVLTQTSLIWMSDSEWPGAYPILTELVPNNVGILAYMDASQLFTDFPIDKDVKLFSMKPIPDGLAFNSGSFSRGGFHLLFRSDVAEPLDLVVYQRAIIFVHNN